MKKILSLLLALVLLFSLAACGKDKPAEAEPKHSENASEPAGKTGENTPAPASGSAEASPASTTDKPADAVPTQMFDLRPTIDKTVLVDEKGVKITATDLIYSGSMAELELLIENGSDTDLSFFINNGLTSLNGVMCDSLWLYCSVPAGGKSTEGVWFENDELAFRGISDIVSIEIGFDIQDENLNFFIEPSPCEILTSLADSFCFPNFPLEDAVSSGLIENVTESKILTCESGEYFSDGGVSVDTAVILEDSFGSVYLYLDGRNSSDEPVELCVRDIYVNGLLLSGERWVTQTVAPGKHGILYVNLNNVLDPSLYASYGIGDLGSVGFTIETADTEYYDTIALGEPVTLVIDAGKNGFDASGETVYQSEYAEIVYKGLIETEYSYSKDYAALFIVRNLSADALWPSTSTEPVTVNGYEVENYNSPIGYIPAGSSAALCLQLPSYSLANIEVRALKDFKDLSFVCAFRDQSSEIVDRAEITLSF